MWFAQFFSSLVRVIEKLADRHAQMLARGRTLSLDQVAAGRFVSITTQLFIQHRRKSSALSFQPPCVLCNEFGLLLLCGLNGRARANLVVFLEGA